MELRHLRCFVAVAEELNFRKAAQRLHVAQPALSRTIKDLECETGVTLLDRDQRSVALTRAGKSFFTDAQRVLHDAQTAVARARECDRSARATLRVGMSESFDRTRVAGEGLAAFRKQFPEVKLELNEMFSSTQADALRKRELDAGIMFDAPQDDSLVVVPLEKLDCCLAIAASHPLAKRSSVRLKELAGENWIIFPRRWWPKMYDRYLEICREAGFEMKIIEEAGRLDTRLPRVAAGAAISIILDYIAAKDFPGVAYLRLRDWPIVYESAATTPPRSLPPSSGALFLPRK